MTPTSLMPSTATDLAAFARVLLEIPGKPSAQYALAAERHGPDSRIARACKEAVLAGGTNPGSWGEGFAPTPYKLMSSEWVARLPMIGGTDRIFSGGPRVGVGSRGLVVGFMGNGGATAQGSYKRISELDFSGLNVPLLKVAFTVVLSQAVLRLSSPQMFNRILDAGAVMVTDTQFVADALAMSPPTTPSSGSILRDLRDILDPIAPGAGSRVFGLIDPVTMRQIAFLEGADGERLFPDVGINGGEIGGVELIATDAVPRTTSGGTVIVVDAARVLNDPGTVLFDASTQSTLAMDDSPPATPDALTVSIPLWQQNLVALRAERHYGYSIQPGAVAVIEDCVYASPLES